MKKYTQEECYRILYDREIKRLIVTELRPDGIHRDKWSRIANKFAVQNTWELFNNQKDLHSDIELLFCKPLKDYRAVITNLDVIKIVMSKHFGKEVLWIETTPLEVRFHFDRERYLSDSISCSYDELLNNFNVKLNKPKEI